MAEIQNKLEEQIPETSEAEVTAPMQTETSAAPTDVENTSESTTDTQTPTISEQPSVSDADNSIPNADNVTEGQSTNNENVVTANADNNNTNVNEAASVEATETPAAEQPKITRYDKYNEIRDKWNKDGNLYLGNGIDYVNINGRYMPLVNAQGNVLDTDGKYYSISDDGAAELYTDDNNMSEEAKSLKDYMFNYFDVHNGDTGSVNDYQFLITNSNGALFGTKAMRDLAEQYGIETDKFGWKQSLLNKIKEDYRNNASGLVSARDSFRQPPVKEDVTIENNGTNDIITADEANAFFTLADAYKKGVKEDSKNYTPNSANGKKMEEEINKFLELHPMIKEKMSNDPNASTIQKINEIGYLVAGDSAMKFLNARYNPDLDKIEQDYDNQPKILNREAERYELDKDYELRKSNRKSGMNAMVNLLSGLGDAIVASPGVVVRDMTDKIDAERANADKTIKDINDNYDVKMENLNKRLLEERNVDAQRRYEMQKLKLQYQHEKELNDANNKSREKIAGIKADNAVDVARIKAMYQHRAEKTGGKTYSANFTSTTGIGTTYTFDSTDAKKSFCSKVLNRMFNQPNFSNNEQIRSIKNSHASSDPQTQSEQIIFDIIEYLSNRNDRELLQEITDIANGIYAYETAHDFSSSSTTSSSNSSSSTSSTSTTTQSTSTSTSNDSKKGSLNPNKKADTSNKKEENFGKRMGFGK